MKFNPKIREGGLVQLAGTLFKHQALAMHVGEKIEVEYNPTYSENLPLFETTSGVSFYMDRVFLYGGGLETPHDINSECYRTAMDGRGLRVVARKTSDPASAVRITKARIKGGALQVHELSTGQWFVPTYVEVVH